MASLTKKQKILCGIEFACFVFCCGVGGVGWIVAGHAAIGAPILVIFFGATLVYSFLAGFFTGGLAMLLLIPVHCVAGLISAGLLYRKLAADNRSTAPPPPAGPC